MEHTTFGKYQLRERINVGGMAEVFLADVDDGAGFDGPVALKRVLPNVARNKEFISMFLDEARLSVQLHHGGIAQVLDAGQIDDSYFIALEHVDGKDLGAILRQCRKQKRPLSVPLACYVASKICEALHYAHNKKDPAGKPLDLVHRDVSPSNILVSYTGDVKVTDFGLAKANGKATQTQAGIVKGKHGYMSPEQAKGEPLDRRSDLFSVGVCLYEMLTAQRLFKGESDFSTLQRVREAEVPALSTRDRRIPSDLERIVTKLLARVAGDRYATASEVVTDLQNFMADSGNLCGPRDLANYMQQAFAADHEIVKSLAKKAPMADGVTGLAAFADLNPVSTVSALIELPDAPPPMLMTEQNPPVEFEAALAPVVPTRAPTLVGMPVPQRHSAPPAHARPASLPPPSPLQARPVTLPPPPPRSSAPSLAPRASASVPPPSMQARSSSLAPTTPRAASLPPSTPRAASLPPASPRAGSLPPPSPSRASASTPPARAASVPPPAPRSASIAPGVVASGPSVQLDWPEEELATLRHEEGQPLHAADKTEQISLPSVWEDDIADIRSTITTEGHDPVLIPKQGFASRQNLVIAAAAVFLVIGGAFALTRGPATASLKLDVTPNDATVLLDGRVLATANPYVIEGLDATKSHTLEVLKDGYSVWSTHVQLEAGATLTLPAVTLDAEIKETGFVLASSPPGAKVFVDGKDTGIRTPARLADLPAGTHKVELQNEGHAPWATHVSVSTGQVVELPVAELVAAPAPATAEATEEVAASDEAAAQDDAAEEVEPAPTRKLTARQRRIAARRARAARSASAATPRPSSASRSARAASSSPAASAGTGTLRINTRPWSNVFVDGRLVGNTPQMGIQLPAGRHRITLVNSDLGIRKLVEVTIVAGKVETKIITLTP